MIIFWTLSIFYQVLQVTLYLVDSRIFSDLDKKKITNKGKNNKPVYKHFVVPTPNLQITGLRSYYIKQFRPNPWYSCFSSIRRTYFIPRDGFVSPKPEGQDADGLAAPSGAREVVQFHRA